MQLTVISSKTAERSSLKDSRAATRNRSKAYLALLQPDMGRGVKRSFIKRTKAGNSRITFTCKPQPGDIYQGRAHYWDADRQVMMSEDFFIGIGHGHIQRLTRDEAMGAVMIPPDQRLCGPAGSLPDINHPQRFLPKTIEFEADA